MTPSAFDWVKARLECTPAKIFQKLQLEIEKDVNTRQSALPSNAGYVFNVVCSGSVISVGINGDKVHHTITFRLTEWGIDVGHDLDLRYKATLSLNDDGECRLAVDGKQLESWQFRRLALESLFFDNPYQL
jgi:hypothetical protein